MVKSKTIIATPPGETIKEQLEIRGMKQNDFAERMGYTSKHICELLSGKVGLTPNMALRLESVLGISADFWNNLEAIYRDKLARAEEENAMDQDIEMLKLFPYNEMKKNEWVSEASNATEKVMNLRNFFEVFKLSVLKEKKFVPGIAYRKLGNSEKSEIASMCWAQKAKIEARKIETNDINIAKLKKDVPKFRKMTCSDPKDFCEELVEALKSCGIALVFLPHIEGSYLHGATFYDGKKIVMGMTVRGKDADKFWFSFFHEIAHIIYGHIGQEKGVSDEDENVANKFSRDTLIPEAILIQFINNNPITRQSILSFSDEIGISPGIIVGRLQYENYIKYSQFNNLKDKYRII